MTEQEVKNIFKGLKIALVLIMGIIFFAIFITIKTALPLTKEGKLKTPEKEAKERAEMISQVLSQVCVSPVLEEDALTLTEIVAGVKEKTKELIFVSVLKPNGEVVAHTDLDKIGEIEEITQGQSTQESLFIYTTPINLQEKTIAFLKLGLDMHHSLNQATISKPPEFSRWILILSCLFLGVFVIIISLTSNAQSAIKKHLAKIIEQKDAELRYLQTEKRRLNDLLKGSLIEKEPILKTEPVNEVPQPEISKKEELVPAMDDLSIEASIDKLDKEKNFSEKELEIIKEIEELLEKPSAIMKEEKPLELQPVDIGKIPLDDTDLKEEIEKEPIKTSTPITISQGEIATIKFTLSEQAPILVTIEGPNGCIVRIFNYKGEKGENTLTWDGKDLFGQFCIAGEYRVLIKEKRLGDVKTIAEPIKIILTDRK